MTVLEMKLPNQSYNIIIGENILSDAGKYFDLERRALIVTDTGVPSEYSERIATAAKEAKIVTVPQGEETKSIDSFSFLLNEMMNFELTRSDCVVAVGGGVVGDLAGFAAACYMRGIDFYNVPTTLLSQVDSSIGGKTAVNLGVTKNIVGAFHQPKCVLIDTETLKTLPRRIYSAGLAEALKMSMTSDKELFEIFENENIGESNIETVILRALMIKKAVVEEDEKEIGVRKILNFGHTLGHGIEALSLGKLEHGECVALGMIPMTAEKERPRLIKILKKLGLPTKSKYDVEKALEFVRRDKKRSADTVSTVFVDEIGKYRIEKTSIVDFCDHIRKNL